MKNSKHKSSYALRLARRKTAGHVNIDLPVARQELVLMDGKRFPVPVIPGPFTNQVPGNRLYAGQFAFIVERDNSIRTRTFTRLRRADELEVVS